MKTLGQRKILVADDDLGFVEMVRSLLEQDGYQVSVAYDGLQAIEVIKGNRPDLVVLDINMPRLDGWDVLWEIRNSDATRLLPVVILTVRKDGESITRGWSAGVDCYLAKPFDAEELLAMVRRLIRVTDDETIPGVQREV